MKALQKKVIKVHYDLLDIEDAVLQRINVDWAEAKDSTQICYDQVYLSTCGLRLRFGPRQSPDFNPVRRGSFTEISRLVEPDLQ